MKKIIITIAAIAVSASALAQVSVSAGYLNQASKQVVTLSESTTKNDDWCANGAFVQGTYSYPISANFDFNAGLKFSYLSRTTTGRTDLGDIHLADAERVRKEYYLQIPLTASYTYKIDKDFAVIAFAGPSLSFGLSSKTNVSYNVMGQNKKEVVNNYEKDDEGNISYKPFNLYLGGGIGAEYKKMLRLSISYDFGLLNRSAIQDVKLTENLLSVGVSFLF